MIGSSAQFTQALPGLSRAGKQGRGCGLAAVSQQAPIAHPMRTGTRGTSAHKSSQEPQILEQQSTLNTPLDVLTDDLRFLQAKTGLDLLTPLQEVKEVHDQVCLCCDMPGALQKHLDSFIHCYFRSCSTICININRRHSTRRKNVLTICLMMQVVAALNPIAGERMQEDLEGRIYALQSELERAHREVQLFVEC